MAGLFNLYDLTFPELSERIASWGCSRAHAATLWRLLYWDCAGSAEEFAELPLKVRKRLESEARLGRLRVVSEVGSSDRFTRKFLLGLDGGASIETVSMQFKGRVTACVSSQAGCSMGCVFCA